MLTTSDSPTWSPIQQAEDCGHTCGPDLARVWPSVRIQSSTRCYFKTKLEMYSVYVDSSGNLCKTPQLFNIQKRKSPLFRPQLSWIQGMSCSLEPGTCPDQAKCVLLVQKRNIPVYLQYISKKVLLTNVVEKFLSYQTVWSPKLTELWCCYHGDKAATTVWLTVMQTIHWLLACLLPTLMEKHATGRSTECL